MGDHMVLRAFSLYVYTSLRYRVTEYRKESEHARPFTECRLSWNVNYSPDRLCADSSRLVKISQIASANSNFLVSAGLPELDEDKPGKHKIVIAET